MTIILLYLRKNRFFASEILVLFSLLLTFNNYIGNSDETIKADGIGYYDYLPSLFLHSDFNRMDSQDCTNTRRIEKLGVYVDYKDKKLNKYACGTALLQAPFFFLAKATTPLKGNDMDGYQTPFHKAIFWAALFYLFLTLVFFRYLLQRYDVPVYLIFISQLFLVLATTLTVYTSYFASFSHVYSLFAITAFLYFAKCYFLNKTFKFLVLSSLFLGLIFLLRPPNLIIIFFLPFLAGSLDQLKSAIVSLIFNWKHLLISIGLIIGICMLQPIMWYMQTGEFFLYPYQGESFNFLKPHFFSILFSYEKGLFVYTPILLIATLMSVFLFFKDKFLGLTWWFFFLFLTFVLSSWWSWAYGGSFGLRAYIEFYPIFFLVLALSLRASKAPIRIAIIGLCALCVPLNIIQSYQFNKYIMHWTNMDKAKYWLIFLQTDEKYEGWFFKPQFESENYILLKEYRIASIEIEKNRTVCFKQLTDSLIQDTDVVQIQIDDTFNPKENSKIIVQYQDEKLNWVMEDRRSILHYFDPENLDVKTGVYNYFFRHIVGKVNLKKIKISCKTQDQSKTLKNVTFRLYREKK